MTKTQKPPAKRRGRPVKHGNPQAPAPTAVEKPLSLPPAAPESVTNPRLPELPTNLVLAPDSSIRTTALKIVAMRASGVGEEEIAKALGLSRSTLAGYVYKAGRNGWLDLDDPKDRLEYQVLHKAVRNIEEGLDAPGEMMTNTGVPLRTHVALKVAEGTVFKKFGTEQAAMSQQTVVAIKIEMPSNGEIPAIREGTTGGAMAYIDAEPTSVKP